MKSLLDIKNLSITFEFNDQTVNAVRDSSFKINRGECLAIVGESGSGKSVTALAIMRLIRSNSQLKITGLRGEGVIVRNSGKIVENDRTRRIDQIQTCFTITANDLSEAGEKNLYVQVYNPENELVGDKIAVEHDGGVMVYSAQSTVYYENDELDVCILANTDKEKLLEGNYKVYVYNDATLIGTASFSLR